MKTALFVVGSFRAKSFNRQLAREAEALLAPRAKVEWTSDDLALDEAGRAVLAAQATAFADFLES